MSSGSSPPALRAEGRSRSVGRRRRLHARQQAMHGAASTRRTLACCAGRQLAVARCAGRHEIGGIYALQRRQRGGQVKAAGRQAAQHLTVLPVVAGQILERAGGALSLRLRSRPRSLWEKSSEVGGPAQSRTRGGRVAEAHNSPGQGAASVQCGLAAHPAWGCCAAGGCWQPSCCVSRSSSSSMSADVRWCAFSSALTLLAATGLACRRARGGSKLFKPWSASGQRHGRAAGAAAAHQCCVQRLALLVLRVRLHGRVRRLHGSRAGLQSAGCTA